MNTTLKKTITLFGLCAALSSGAVFGVTVQKAYAAEHLTSANAQLVLPSSYEQYLALTAPTDIAVSDRFVAVSDGNKLFLYDRDKARYTQTELAEGRTVSTLGFAGDRLFLADTGGSNYFYEYNFTTSALERIDINCSTFCIDGNDLYTATVSAGLTTIARYPIDELRSSVPTYEELGRIDNRNTPSLTVLNGTLYCTFEAQVFYPNPASGMFGADSFWLASSPSMASGVQSVCAFENMLYYTADGGFYRTDIAASESKRLIEGNGFSALTSYGEFLYAVQGTSVKQIALTEEGAAFTDYEIASASNSVNRLSGATDSVRAGDLLVTADAGNQRISVSQLKSGESGNPIDHTYAIPCVAADGMPYTPSLVATDGNLIAVSSNNYIYLYHRDETTYFYRHLADTTHVKGLVCVYGECYYVTEYGYGKAEEGFTAFPRSGNAPKALCADVYGTLYVVTASGDVQTYTEENFVNPVVVRGTSLEVSMPEDFTSLRADFEGNLYCISGNSFLQNGKELLAFSELAENVQFVYGGEIVPVSYALGYEDGEIYFLFGNYIVRTNAGTVKIPTLSEISANGVFERVFTPHTSEQLLIDIPKGTIGIRTDLDQLSQDPEYFPYSSYYRTEEDMRGILLTSTGQYALVVLYEISQNSRVFTANLFRMGTENVVSEEEYWQESNTVMYLSNDVSAYYYPCLHTALAGNVLTRGDKVTVLGYAEAPERSYALVEIIKSGRATERGFIPVSYLTAVNPIPMSEIPYESAWLKATKDGIEFQSESGETLLVCERTEAQFIKNDDGTFYAVIQKDGKTYTANVPANAIDRGESDALRISLIVILTVLAVGIVGGYVYLLPRKKNND